MRHPVRRPRATPSPARAGSVRLSISSEIPVRSTRCSATIVASLGPAGRSGSATGSMRTSLGPLTSGATNSARGPSIRSRGRSVTSPTHAIGDAGRIEHRQSGRGRSVGWHLAVEELEERLRLGVAAARRTNRVARGPDVLGSSRQGERRACRSDRSVLPGRAKGLPHRSRPGGRARRPGRRRRRAPPPAHQRPRRAATDRTICEGHVGAMITGYTGVIVKSIWS